MRRLGIRNTNFVLEVHMPQAEAFLIVQDYESRQAISQGITLNQDAGANGQDPTQFQDGFTRYGIRFIFDETPRKFYAKPNGGGSFTLVEVPLYINVPGDVGLVPKRNPEYDQSCVVCKGIKYDVFAVATVLDEASFRIHPFADRFNPAGDNLPSTYATTVTGHDLLFYQNAPDLASSILRRPQF
jgi:hypothetical protein